MNIDKLKALLSDTTIIVPHNEDDEAMRVNFIVDDEIYLTGEDTGEEYAIGLEEFDVEDYKFYRLSIIDIDDY